MSPPSIPSSLSLWYSLRASITFLNDDLVGGEAVVEGVKITPLLGRTYYLDGKEHKHAVMNVIKGSIDSNKIILNEIKMLGFEESFSVLDICCGSQIFLKNIN